MHSVKWTGIIYKVCIAMHTCATENTLKYIIESIVFIFPNMQLFLYISEHRLF